MKTRNIQNISKNRKAGFEKAFFKGLLLSLLLTGLIACTKESAQDVIPQTNTPDQPTAGQPIPVTMVAPPVNFAGETKSAMVVNESTGLSFVWSPGDKTGVYSTTDGFACFNLTSGSGTSSAQFNGGGFSLTEGATYYSFYPYEMSATDKTAVPITYASQSLTTDNDIVSPMSKDYMYASAVATASGANFNYNHLGSFVRLKMGLTAGTNVSSVDIVPMYTDIIQTATVNVTSSGAITPATTTPCRTLTTTGVSVPAGGVLTLWAAMAPQNFSTDSWAIISHSGDDIYSVRIAGDNLVAGKAYRHQADQIPPTGYEHGFTVTTLEQKTWGTGLGQYSGIFWISGNNYAVIDDKLNGGGIMFFTIPINLADGTVGEITSSVAPGTSASAVTDMDNEGVAYFNSKFYVTAEADQSISEYDSDGYPTGTQFTVPADMAVGKIAANSGFEAFTYNASTHRFWTTTEAPLTKDNFIPRLHRLQAFNESFTKAERYLYQMDAPQYSSEGTSQYVHGISAMVALDDGRLIVLEREVYVPTANPLLSRGIAKLYVVDPVNDTAGILRKSLLKLIETTPFNFANYEGMCLGPTLDDGSRCLLLISDSQATAREYIQLLTIK